MQIRPSLPSDYDGIWEIFKRVIATGDAFVFHPDTPKEDLQKHWFAPYMKSWVLTEGEKILGSYVIKPNHIGLGGHVANASYMVHPEAQGRGIGKILCEHSLIEAKNAGFSAMQFNIVVSTNTGAVHLWQKCGFRIIGAIPEAFNHLELGLVDAYVMYQKL